MPRVLLANMPFDNLRWPNLGLGLLKAALVRREFPATWRTSTSTSPNGRIGTLPLAGRPIRLRPRRRTAFRQAILAKKGTAPFQENRLFPPDADYYREVLLAADPEMSEADHAAFLDTARASSRSWTVH